MSDTENVVDLPRARRGRPKATEKPVEKPVEKPKTKAAVKKPAVETRKRSRSRSVSPVAKKQPPAVAKKANGTAVAAETAVKKRGRGRPKKTVSKRTVASRKVVVQQPDSANDTEDANEETDPLSSASNE